MAPDSFSVLTMAESWNWREEEKRNLVAKYLPDVDWLLA
jgi:hypothetical protein